MMAQADDKVKEIRSKADTEAEAGVAQRRREKEAQREAKRAEKEARQKEKQRRKAVKALKRDPYNVELWEQVSTNVGTRWAACSGVQLQATVPRGARSDVYCMWMCAHVSTREPLALQRRPQLREVWCPPPMFKQQEQPPTPTLHATGRSGQGGRAQGQGEEAGRDRGAGARAAAQGARTRVP